jgi:hypothetical protein
LRFAVPTNPSSPVPSNSKDEGSGVAAVGTLAPEALNPMRLEKMASLVRREVVGTAG